MNPRRMIGVGFSLALVVLLSIGIVSYRTTTRFEANADWVTHTREVLENLGGVISNSSAAESGARGYVMTADRIYLQPYWTARERLDQELNSLRKLTADNPRQLGRLDTLEPLVKRRLALLQEMIDLRESRGPETAWQSVQTNKGKQVMDEIQALIEEMENEERESLKKRNEEVKASARATIYIIVFGSVLALAILPLAGMAINHEIKKRQRAEEAVRESEQRLQAVLDNSPAVIYVKDTQGRYILVNRRFEDLFHVTRAQVEGKTDYDLFPKEMADNFRSNDEKVLRAGTPLEFEEVAPSDDGLHTYIAIKFTLRHFLGFAYAVCGISTDITERKRAQEELRQQKEILQSILGSMGDGVAVADENGKFLFFNPAAEQIMGLGATDVPPAEWTKRYGVYLPDTITPYSPEDLPLARAMRGEAVDGAELFVRNPNTPGGVWVNVTGRPLKHEDGTVRGGVVVFRDVTLAKQAEQALVRAKEEAERTSRFKDQFLSTMSHELRTPLNAILGFSELLSAERYGTLNERQSRYITHIHTSGQHLLRLINDILELSKIEAGHIALAVENVSIGDAFAEVLSVLRPLAELKSQTISHHAEPDLAVRADRTRFKQILLNLLGNAIKFTPAGGHVELSAGRTNDEVRIAVQDTGPGIPPEEQQRIFEVFYQLRKSGEAAEGMGLGLAITRRLLELQGSRLALDSQPGQGSCFHFRLPVAAAVPPVAPQKSALRGKSEETPRILVIEDDPVAGQLIQTHLTASGYEVVLCNQPGRAVEIVAELQPDAITLDILMEPTGWEVLLQLKNDARTASVPIIVVTIVDQPGMGAALGADEYLVKPVERSALLAAVQRCLVRRGGAPPKRPILVIEDDTPTREVITELLTEQGYAVATAADGAEARAQVATSLPELVILDLLLPRVSGFELLAEWRASPRTADLPVFILTSKDLTREEEIRLRAHAELLLRKEQPWQQTLLDQIRRVMVQNAPETV